MRKLMEKGTSNEDITKNDKSKYVEKLESRINRWTTFGNYPNEISSEKVFEKYKYNLQAIFEHYCSYGESENISKLKCAKYIKLLRDCEIVRPLNNVLY